MKRKTYQNGDEVGLSTGCDGCSIARINGVLCHETGCTEAWKDKLVECFICGYGFFPEERNLRVCPDCSNSED